MTAFSRLDLDELADRDPDLDGHFYLHAVLVIDVVLNMKNSALVRRYPYLLPRCAVKVARLVAQDPMLCTY